MMPSPEEEIHFLVDEITEHINKELGSILYQLQDPSAKNRLRFLQQFTRRLIRATGQQQHSFFKKNKQFSRPPIQAYVDAVAQSRTPRRHTFLRPPLSAPLSAVSASQLRTPYYTSLVHSSPTSSTLPPPSLSSQEQKPPAQKIFSPEEAAKNSQRSPEKSAESELETITRETVHLDLPEEQTLNSPSPETSSQSTSPQRLVLSPSSGDSSPEHQTINLIKESESNQTVVSANATSTHYRVLEPSLTKDEQALLFRLERDLSANKDVAKDKAELYAILQNIARQMNLSLHEDTKLKLRYYLIRNLFNLQHLEPLLHDEKIEKIICEGIGKPVILLREDKILETNILFTRQEDINALLGRVAKKTYQQLSLDEPILDVTYKDFRVQGNLGTDLVPAKFIMTKQ